MTHIKRFGLVLVLLFFITKPFSVFAIVHGDVELLKSVALKNKANFGSLLTWKGEAFEEMTSTRGDSYDYMIKNKCNFTYDQLKNAVRWNKEPQENRFVVDDNSLRDINAFYNSAMIKERSSYQYSALGLRGGKETYHLVIGDRKLARGWEKFCLDPCYFYADPGGGDTIYNRLMFLYDNANNPKLSEWYVKRAGDLVTLEIQFGDNNENIEKYVFNLSLAGNLIKYLNITPNAENIRDYEYEEKSGVWVLRSYNWVNITRREDGDLRTTRKINWGNSVVNVPFDEDEFTVKKLGLKHGDRVSDHRIGKGYIYEGTLIEPPPSPKTLIKEKLPELKDIGINLSTADINNKSILVCFFDLEQRPSRNCILQLSKRAQELKAKDIVVVAVQASKIEQAKLNDWIRENEVDFPVGMISGDPEKVPFAWGVKSLPWLILTDKNHIVTAEGFGLDELDEKLKL